MPLYTAWRIDEKGAKHWLEGIVADTDAEAWEKGCVILDDWLKVRPRERSRLVIGDSPDSAWEVRRDGVSGPVPDTPPHKSLSPFENECSFVFDENTAAHFIVGALTPAQKAAVLVDLLRGLQAGSVVGCLDLAADENPLMLKMWLAQLEWCVHNKTMAHDEIAARSILGNSQG